MKKTSASYQKLTSMLVLTAILLAPIATPQIADAQRAGTVAARPTASLSVSGSKNATVETGSAAPKVSWSSSNGAKYRTVLKVNNAAKCGIKNNQLWNKGKNAKGTAVAPSATKGREGCVLTFTYEVTNRFGQKATDSITVQYIAASTNTGTNTPTKPTTPTKQKLKVVTPNGGERWMLNSSNTTITWTPEPHADGMVAYLEKKSGKSFVTVGKVVEAAKGSIQWFGEIEKNGVVTYATPGTGYYIRIVNTSTGETDRSDKPFTILAVDAFEVDLQPADENNYLRITEAGDVRLSWDARTPGVSNITCTLRVFDRHWNTVINEKVPAVGTYEVYAELPDPSHNNDNHYTLANITCNSSLGERGDYVEVISDVRPSNPTLSIQKTGNPFVHPGENIAYVFEGTDLNVPSNVFVDLYTPIDGYVSDLVRYGNIGESTFTRSSEYGTLFAPSTPGEYRLTVCDDNTPNPEVPFKPLCAHSDYFTVVEDGTAPNILVEPVSTTTLVDPVDFPGDIARGIYEIEVQVYAIGADIFIPSQVSTVASSSAGFIVALTDAGVPFSGTTTTYISAETSPIEVGGLHKIPQGTADTFTVRVELDPSSNSEGYPYGAKLTRLMYGVNSTNASNMFVFPNNSNFETNKVTIAAAIPTGVIEETLAQGETGEQVTLVQAALKKAGLFNEEITGYFGSITRAAVKAFQREHALENVGAVGPRTAQLMNQLLNK